MRCCEFCGRESTGRLTRLTPTEAKKNKRGLVVDAGTYVYLCESHERAARNGEGWQEREAEDRKRREEDAAVALRREQTELF